MSQTAFYDRLVMNHGQDYDRSKLRLDFAGGNGNAATSNFLLNQTGSRKRRFMPMQSPATLLQSPDLKLLKLGSPELEKIIINNNGFIPTPTAGNPFGIPNGGLQEDQDRLAQGFIAALQKLQEQDGPQARWETASVGASSNSGESVTSVDIPSSVGLKLPITTAEQWKLDQNRNSVPVIMNRYVDSRATPPPSMSRLPAATNTNKNTLYDTIISTTSSNIDIGTNSLVPRTQSYMTKPEDALTLPAYKLSHNNLNASPKASPLGLHSMMGSSTPGPMFSAQNSPLMVDQASIKSEEDSNQIVPSITPSVMGDANSLAPSGLDMNPINLEVQEHIKHERKKLRNRLAAQRCRKRKIEREDTLKSKVKELKQKNADLSTLASNLRMQVCELKQQVMQHVNEGCSIFVEKDSTVTAAELNALKDEA